MLHLCLICQIESTTYIWCHAVCVRQCIRLCLMSVFHHVKHILISCVICIIALHSCAWLSNLRGYFCVTQRLCFPVVLSVRRCCLDKHTGREVPDNRLGPAWGPLTVTLIATLLEQQGGHDHCILNVLFVFIIINVQNCCKVGFGVITVFEKSVRQCCQFSNGGRGRWNDGSPSSSHSGDLKHSPMSDSVCPSAIYQKWCQISLRKQILPTDCHSVS